MSLDPLRNEILFLMYFDKENSRRIEPIGRFNSLPHWTMLVDRSSMTRGVACQIRGQ